MKSNTNRSNTDYTKKIRVSIIQDECSFNFNTELHHVQVPAQKLKVKDTLSVQAKGRKLAAVTRKQEVCGYILSPYNGNILKCIQEKGKKYNAIVYAIDSNTYKIEIKVVQ